MGDDFCYLCEKKLGFRKHRYWMLTSLYVPPEGMTKGDSICNDCAKTLTPKYLEKQEKTLPMPEKESSSKSFDSSKVIQYKDSKVCILTHMIGSQKEFYSEFSNLTEQGYELKSTFAPSTSFIGIGGAPMAICYFQKMEYSQ